MTLQTSGAISLSQVQSEFGGSNPISISEYYRGGGRVPTQITVGGGSYSSYYGTQSSPAYYWSQGFGALLVWNGSTVYSNISTQSTVTSLSNVNGFDYERGTSFATSTSSGKFPITTTYYRIRRRATASTITVNQNIPSSGTIDMAKIYGGRNS